MGALDIVGFPSPDRLLVFRLSSQPGWAMSLPRPNPAPSSADPASSGWAAFGRISRRKSRLGPGNLPAVFTQSELWVTLAVVSAKGTLVVVRDNRRAFLSGLGLCATGLGFALLALAGHRSGLLMPFAYMVLLGMGMYVPYVAVHTTLFERLIALTRERGNIGYLMYLADAVGCLGYVGVMMSRRAFPAQKDFLAFFLPLAEWLLAGALVAVAGASVHYARRDHDAGRTDHAMAGRP